MQVLCDLQGIFLIFNCQTPGTDDYWPTKWEMNERIKMEFDQEGITIPYQQLDVHLKSENSDLQKQCSKK